MNMKQTLIWVLAASVLTVGWLVALSYIERHYPDVARKEVPPESAPAVTQPAVLPPPTTAPTTMPTTMASTQSVGTGLYVVAGAPAPATTQLGAAQPHDPAYSLQMTLSANGAAVESVVLNDFYKTVERKELYAFQQPVAALGPGAKSLATHSVTIDGQTLDISAANWALSQSSIDSATYSLTIARGASPVLRIDKAYHLSQKNQADRGYEVGLNYTLANLGATPISVKLVFGGLQPPTSEFIGHDSQVAGGYWDQGIIKLDQHAISSLTGEKVNLELTHNEEKQPLLWSGFIGDYFNALLLPDSTLPKELPGGWIAKTSAHGMNPDSHGDHATQSARLSYETAALALSPAQSISHQLQVYLGPKWRDVLKGDHYTEPPRRYDATLVPPRAGPCGFCTFNWLINLMVWLLAAFHWLILGFAGHGDWGLAIICLVVVVRTCLHPITKRSQVHMMKMGKLGPEMEALKKKYADDKDELNRQTMQLYKQQGFTPLLGCAPMFLQTPIWIALYAVLQSTFELRHAPLFWGLTWIDDLAQPDRLISFARPVSFYFFSIDAINLLPVLLAVVFFMQQKYTPKPPATTPEQQQQQKMMQWMSLLFPVFLYKLPSGLNLYILTSTTIGIIEAKIVRKHIREREEAEKAGKVIVDAGPMRGGGGRKGKDEPPPKKGGMMGWLADLQAKAEEMRDQQRRGGKDRA